MLHRFEEITAKLNEDPNTTEDMDALEKFVVAVEAEKESIQSKILQSLQVAEVLEHSHHSMRDECSELYWRLRHWPVALEDELAGAMQRLQGFNDRYRKQLKADQQQLADDISQVKVGRSELTGNMHDTVSAI